MYTGRVTYTFFPTCRFTLCTTRVTWEVQRFWERPGPDAIRETRKYQISIKFHYRNGYPLEKALRKFRFPRNCIGREEWNCIFLKWTDQENDKNVLGFSKARKGAINNVPVKLCDSVPTIKGNWGGLKRHTQSVDWKSVGKRLDRPMPLVDAY